MTPAEIKTHCLSHPGASHVVQWGDDHVFKVAGKMFAAHGSYGVAITLKCESPDAAAMLIEIGAARRAPYLPRGGWVSFDLDDLEDHELRARLTASYEMVKGGLPKRVQAELGVD